MFNLCVKAHRRTQALWETVGRMGRRPGPGSIQSLEERPDPGFSVPGKLFRGVRSQSQRQSLEAGTGKGEDTMAAEMLSLG